MSVKLGQCLKCNRPTRIGRAYCEDHQQQFEALLDESIRPAFLNGEPMAYDINAMRIVSDIMKSDAPRPPKKATVYTACLKIRNWCDKVTRWPFDNEERFTRCGIWFVLGLLTIGIVHHVGVWAGWWTP